MISLSVSRMPMAAEAAEIRNRIFHTLGDQSVAAVKLLAAVEHFKAQNARLDRHRVLAAQEDLAPSQTMPDVTASAFTIVWEISRQPPPCRYVMPAPAPAPALTAPQ